MGCLLWSFSSLGKNELFYITKVLDRMYYYCAFKKSLGLLLLGKIEYPRPECVLNNKKERKKERIHMFNSHAEEPVTHIYNNIDTSQKQYVE